MNQHEIYCRGNWCVVRHTDPNRRNTYAVSDVKERRAPIETIDLKAAIEIVDCLNENAI